ncbi:MAG: purine-binding chemotaxis protein CheW, partial [Deltaproteobacteria bacterium]
ASRGVQRQCHLRRRPAGAHLGDWQPRRIRAWGACGRQIGGCVSVEATSGKERFLCFHLGHDAYAIPLLAVKEVIAISEITAVPQTPKHFLGIINLRGQVISVVDLRIKLALQAERGPETAIIICEMSHGPVGFVVDSIDSVLHPKAGDIAPKPALTQDHAADYIRGVFRHQKVLVLLLDISAMTDLAHVDVSHLAPSLPQTIEV